MSGASTSPANWYGDPTGRHHYRFFDGTSWTDQVSDNGVLSADPVERNIADSIEQALSFSGTPSSAEVSEMVHGTGWGGAGITPGQASGNGTLFGEPVLVVSQKAKLVEITNQYSVVDQHGNQLGFVNEVGQSAAKKALRLLTSFDQFLTHRLEITDRNGEVVMRLTRPAKVFKSTLIVEAADGTEIGRILQDNMIGKIHFTLQVNGETLGSINAENWRAWNFNIKDNSGTEIARISKTWEGLAKAMFTTADNYVVQIHAQIPQPLLSLVVASALTVDTALKQDR